MTRFDGTTYEPTLDGERLGTQLARVFGIMCEARTSDQWLTLEQIARLILGRWGVKASEASVSARLRDLRKERYGGHKVHRRRVKGADGLFEYQLEPAGQKRTLFD